jgi:hypothetical protein
MDKNGDLIKGFTDAYTVRGDTGSFGSGTSFPSDGVPQWTDGKSTDGNAVNALGKLSGTDSDPMFDKFKHEAKGWEDQVNADSNGQSGASVSHSALVEGGAKSDPQGQELANEQSIGPGALSSQADKD